LVLFLNFAEAKYYAGLVGVNLSDIKYKILPICTTIKPSAHLEYFTGQRKCLNLCWCGTYIPLHGLDKIIKAMKLLSESKLDFHLYIWGSSDISSYSYSKLISDLGMERSITIHNEWGGHAHEKLDKFMNTTCDINLGIFGESDKAKTVLANKVIGGVAYKTPTLTAMSSGINLYFDGVNDIFICRNTPSDIAESIMKISKMPLKTIRIRVENAYKIFIKNFSADVFKRNLEKILNDYR
jgi:glycosyltransferase involved in cell wall biosynthesis